MKLFSKSIHSSNSYYKEKLNNSIDFILRKVLFEVINVKVGLAISSDQSFERELPRRRPNWYSGADGK